MTRRRALDWLLIVVLTASWGALFVRGIGEGLRTQRGQLSMGVSSAPSAGAYPTVVWSGCRDLKRGDQLEAVAAEDLRGSSALHFYDRATRAARERGSVSVRASRDGTPFEARLELAPSEWWWVPFSTSAAVLLIALLLLVRAPGWHLARRNLVALFCFAAQALVFDPFGGPVATSSEAIFSELLVAFGAGLFVWNAQEFTLSARPVPRLHRAFAVVTGILFAGNFLAIYFLPYPPLRGDVLAFICVAFVAVVAPWGLGRAYLRSDSLERRQVRWVILGFSIAVGGSVLATLAAFAAGNQLRPIHFDHGAQIARVVRALTSLGVPIGVLVSVIGYRWLDVDRLISAAASYSIVGLSVLGGTLAVIPRLAQAVAPTVGLDPAITQWFLTLSLVAAAIPGHRFLRPRIDRRLFAERHQRTQGFERLLDEIGGYASVEELVRLAAERIDALLEPESIAVYRRERTAFTPFFVRGRPAPPPFEGDSMLVRALERRGEPLSADAAELDAFDRAALETLGVELVVPIRGSEGVTAFACLGPKRSRDIYTNEDVAQLTAVANRCSEVLLRLAEPSSARDDAESLPQVFRREGELWTIASAGKEIRLRDMRGLQYLAMLLREPGREFHASELVSAGTGGLLTAAPRDPSLSVVNGLGDAGARLDSRARAAYGKRLRDLVEEQADAERSGDLGRLDRASEEREALLAELSAAARGSRASSHGERARTAVTKAIKAALDKISERNPELGAHLSATIRRGYLCAYVPDPRASVEWEL